MFGSLFVIIFILNRGYRHLCRQRKSGSRV